MPAVIGSDRVAVDHYRQRGRWLIPAGLQNRLLKAGNEEWSRFPGDIRLIDHDWRLNARIAAGMTIDEVGVTQNS